MIKKSILSLAALVSIVTANNQMEINLNNDTLEVAGKFYLNNKYNVSNDANYYFTASYLKSEVVESVDQSLLSIGLNIINPFTSDRGLSFGLGLKTVYVDISSINKTFVAIPLGLFAKYEHNDALSFDVELGYAPKTLSFSDAEKYADLKMRVNYKILDNGYVFVGARKIEATYTNIVKPAEYDDNVFFGYKVQF